MKQIGVVRLAARLQLCNAAPRLRGAREPVDPDVVAPIRWLSVLWIEPKKVPRSRRRPVSDKREQRRTVSRSASGYNAP